MFPLLSVEQVTFFFTAERQTTGNSSRRETGANKSTLLPLNRREAKNICFNLFEENPCRVVAEMGNLKKKKKKIDNPYVSRGF